MSRARRILVVMLAGIGLLAVGSGAATSEPDGRPRPLRYDLSATWTPSDRMLAATETIHLRNGGPGTLPVVWLRLWPNDSIPSEADGCRHRRLEIERVRGASVGGYAVACSAVALNLPSPLAPGETAAVTLEFSVSVPTDNALFGRSAGIGLFGRAVPTLAVRDADGWHLNPDTAIGDPGYSLSAVWSATLRMPAALEVAGTGAKVSDTVAAGTNERVVVAYAPHARDFGFAIGRLRILTATVAGNAVKVFFSASTSRATAARALSNTVKTFGTYLRWYGPYDGSLEYDVVLTRLGLDSQELPGVVFTNPGLAYIAHETAHQWFYGIVGDDQYDEPSLDESFASWTEEQFAPGTYPCNRSDPLGKHRGLLGLGLRYYEHRPALYVDVVYRGGSCALTALEGMLGRDRFLALLRREVSLYRYGVIDTSGFLTLLRETDAAVASRWSALVGLPR